MKINQSNLFPVRKNFIFSSIDECKGHLYAPVAFVLGHCGFPELAAINIDGYKIIWQCGYCGYRYEEIIKGNFN